MKHCKLKINLLKLNGAFVHTIKGLNSTKRCVCIPIDENNIFEGRKGYYLSLVALKQDNPRYGDSHVLKPGYSKEQYESMSWMEKSAVAIVGGMREIE